MVRVWKLFTPLVLLLFLFNFSSFIKENLLLKQIKSFSALVGCPTASCLLKQNSLNDYEEEHGAASVKLEQIYPAIPRKSQE